MGIYNNTILIQRYVLCHEVKKIAETYSSEYLNDSEVKRLSGTI